MGTKLFEQFVEKVRASVTLTKNYKYNSKLTRDTSIPHVFVLHRCLQLRVCVLTYMYRRWRASTNDIKFRNCRIQMVTLKDLIASHQK